MKGNKFLAAVLAASMAFSMVPVTTVSVLADAVSVEAANAKVAKDDYITVKAVTNGDEDTAETIKAAIENFDFADADSAGAFTSSDHKTITDATKFNTYVTRLPGLSGFTVDTDSYSYTDDSHFSFKIYNANGTYQITVAIEPVLPTTISDALTAYFEDKEFETTSDKTFTNTNIATEINEDNNKPTALITFTDGSPAQIDGGNASATYDISYTGNGDAVSDGQGTLTVTLIDKVQHNGSTFAKSYKYKYTANITVKDVTASEANRKAIAEINSFEYPDWHTYANGEESLKAKIKADLKDAGFSSSSFDAKYTQSDIAHLNASTNKKATSTADGEYKLNVGNDNIVDVALKYSSTQKSADTTKSLNKFLKRGTSTVLATASGVVNAYAVTEHTKTDSSAKIDDYTIPAGTYEFSTSSTVSKAVQAANATSATSAADAATAVQNLINEQLKKDGVDSNGVTVTVTPVNVTPSGTDNDNDGVYDVTKVDSGYGAATLGTGHGGKVVLLVKTSINNDFYGWPTQVDGTTTDTTKYTTTNNVVVVDTNPLKENKVKTISLSDKTVLLTGGYYGDSKSNGQTSANEVTYVEITPVIDPKDANSTIKYTVLDSDKSVVTDTVKVGTDDVYKKDSNTAVKVGTNALGLKITKEGTYTIKATVDNAEATMTLTVKKNFDDVPATAYYYDAVKWAYANDMTAGISPNKFGVNNSVTRAQYVTWLYNYAVSRDSSVAIADEDVKATYSDVATSAYYAKAVQWATNAGVTGGTGTSTFSPNKTITRAEAIVMLWAAKGRPYAGTGSEYQPVLHFTDVPTSAYYATAVTWAVQGSVTTGTSTTTFSPDNTCTRSQAITFIYGAYAPRSNS